MFPNAVRGYVPETTVPHVMWAEPCDFGDLSSFSLAGAGDVHVLHAMPVTETERKFLVERGFDARAIRLESGGAAHHDLYREPVFC